MSIEFGRKTRVAAVAATCLIGTAIGGVGALGAPANAATHHTAAPQSHTSDNVTSGGDYLALGDSVSFGYRESNAIPTADNNYNKPNTFIGYPEDIASNLGLKLTNLACPGETSASFIDTSKPSNGCENSPSAQGQVPQGYRTAYPLHAKYSGSQLSAAVKYLKANKNTQLVSLMIGANDGFLCQETTADMCESEFNSVLTEIQTNTAKIIKTIREKAHYSGQLVLVTYYSTDYADATTTEEIQAINDAMIAAGKNFHVEVANSYGQFKKAAKQAKGDTCAAELLTQLKNGTTPCGVHPSVAGQALLAQAVEQTIKK